MGAGEGGGPDFHRGLGPRDPTEAAEWEVEHHLAELVDRLVAEGMEEEEARREAERRFGNPRVYRTDLARNERRRRTMMRRMEVWGIVTGSVGSVARTVRRSPGFAAGVVLTLALGIGANATMFSVLDRLLFRPPAHVTDPDAVRRLLVEQPFLGRTVRGATITFPDYEAFKEVDAFAGAAAWSGPRDYTIGRGEEATRARVAMATWDFFPLLGVHPAFGHFYTEDDDQGAVEGTAVISREYWERAFGGARDVLGRTLMVSGQPFTIVGVAPAGFTGVDLAPVDIWLPLVNAGLVMNGSGWRNSTGWYWLSAVVRMAPGAALPAAEEQATALHLARREEDIAKGNYSDKARVQLDPLIAARGPEASGESKVARWLGGVSLLVLLIACANVANLFLARGTRRRREVAVRLALGVGRGRLVGMMVLESLALALVGGAVALVLAYWGGSIVRDTLLPGVLFTGSVVGGRAALFTVGMALVAGLLAGVGPALQATRGALTDDLSMGAGSGAGRRSRTRAFLTVAQAALSVVLLVGAGLFVRSVGRVDALDLGLDTHRLVLATLEMETIGVFPVGTTPDSGAAFDGNAVYEEALRLVRQLPGVDDAAGTSSPFLWSFATELAVPGLDSLPQLAGGGPYFYEITPDYFATVGLRITRGRGIEASDGPGAMSVAVVSETMARTLWPDADPLGRCLLVDEKPKGCTTVVGVAEDAARGHLNEEPFMSYYMPLAQREGRRLNALYVRTSGDPAELAARLSPVLRGFDPHVRFANVRPLQEVLEPQTRSWRLGATMFTVFGLLALLVAAVGLYGVLAFEVAQRTRELGIRTALGAERGRLLRGVVLSGVALAATGVLLGLAVAFAAGPFVGDLLFQVSPRDPWVLGSVATVLLTVSVLASLLPGMRATRVDPMVALRTE